MKIVIAGSGCAKCKATEETFRRVCAAANFIADIEHLYDMREIAKLGVMLTPAVLIDGKLVMSGKVPADQDVKKLLGIS
ncbi:MAG: thioredoxin family protein [Nitrospinae bacterium]|nr:thioredoxin family protein [Nitrospinota bacterium]MBF0633205.1 thioredoxin family protein [Nitrospinota bacterium]